jgi:hypothetical protein
LYKTHQQPQDYLLVLSGSVLTTDGTDPIWSNAEGKNVYMLQTLVQTVIQVHNIYLLKQFKYALSVLQLQEMLLTLTQLQVVQAVLQVLMILHKQVQLVQVQVHKQELVLDGSSTPTVTITNGGSGHAAGDVVTFSDSGSQLGGATSYYNYSCFCFNW